MIAVEEQFARYEAELRELRMENEQLRRSALAFGALAERLNHALMFAVLFGADSPRHDCELPPAPTSAPYLNR